MKPYTISRTSLILLSISVITCLKDLPSLAEFGLDVIFYLFASLVFFFIPITLVSVELTTLFPNRGGVYLWVSEAFGNKAGFLTIWLQWMGNVFWFPTLLSFAAASIAYILYPPFAENQLFMISTVLISFWGLTFLNTLGLRVATRMTTIGVLLGTLLPGLFIILLGILWLSSGNQPTESFTWNGLFPSLEKTTNLVYLSAVLLAFLGIELPAVHIEDIEQPKKDYPRALLAAMILIFLLFLFGSLSVASVVPKETLNIETGVMQGFEFFFQQYNIQWMTYLFALLTAIGAFATINVWILGPTKGLIVAGQKGDLPPFFHKTNEYNMPTNLLILQAIIVTILSLILLMIPDSIIIFTILGVLTGFLYVTMYLFIFAAAIRHRIKYPIAERKGTTQLPMIGFWIIAVLGTCGSLFIFLTGFIPPASLVGYEIILYEVVLVFCFILSLLMPFIILTLKKPSWDMHIYEVSNTEEQKNREE